MARIIAQATMIASLELPVRCILRPLVATTLSMGHHDRTIRTDSGDDRIHASDGYDRIDAGGGDDQFSICAYRLGSVKGHPIFACDHLFQIDSKR
ncbi:hypothetical protein HED63_24395 [Ochrobactrum cytisi]|nr:hypothetical protein [Brucella cytisi]